MTQPARPPSLGLALMVGLAVAWGTNWPIMKIALLEIPVWTFRAWTCVAAGLCLLALARAAGGAVRPAAGEWRKIAVAALFNVSAWHMLVGYGLILIASGQAAVLSFTMPLWSALIGVAVLGETLSRRLIVALALGVGGVAVLLSRDLAAVGESPVGAVLMLAAAVSWAIATLYQKRQRWRVQTLALAGWQLLIGAIPIFLALPFVEGFHVPDASMTAWLATAYLVFVALVFAYFAWFKIVSLFPATIAGLGTLLTPVVAMVSGSIVLDEPFGWRELMALLLIGGALALVLIVPAMRVRAVPASAE